MPKISVVIITYNEEGNIKHCLESIKTITDEIVIVDSYSTDNTEKICKEYKTRFIKHKFEGHIEQKNWAAQQAKHQYILSLDADEVISEELQKSISEIKNNLSYDGYFVNRLNNYCGKWIKHSGWYPDRVVRLYNKKNYHYNDAYVHESVSCDGAKVLDLTSDLYHYTVNTLDEYIAKRNRYAQDWAKRQYDKGKRASIAQIMLHPLFAFIRHYILRLGILDGYHGFLIAVIQMQYTFNKYNFLYFMKS